MTADALATLLKARVVNLTPRSCQESMAVT